MHNTARLRLEEEWFILLQKDCWKKKHQSEMVERGSFKIDPETDELLFSHISIFGGYANKLEDLATYEQPSVLHTGDTARKGENGMYYITGRIKRIMKLFGIRLNLDEVEFILKK